MEPSIVTRAMHADDYDLVIQLWTSAEGVEIAEGDDRASILRFLQRNPELSRVALLSEKIAGAVLCGHDGRRGLIYHLAVDHRHRGKGIGRRLVEECLTGLRACGIQRALILVEKDNNFGREFWLARGFEEISGALPFGIDV